MPEVKLVITFTTETGQVNINGPINDKMFVHGLLGLALEALRDHWAKQNRGAIVVPQLHLDGPLKQ